MLMCIQNLVKFCPLVLKILSGNEMVTDLRNSGIVELRNSGITEGQRKSNIKVGAIKTGIYYFAIVFAQSERLSKN